MNDASTNPQISAQDSPWKIFLVFLHLGLTSFGGPIAHLGFFRTEFVDRRRWLDEEHYADVVALSQFLPGPASSKVGIIIGVLRAGIPGALAAWLGFTMPSALALIAFGYGVTALGDLSDAGWLHGLKIVAVAVVAQAVWGMAKNLCPDRERLAIAAAATVPTPAIASAMVRGTYQGKRGVGLAAPGTGGSWSNALSREGSPQAQQVANAMRAGASGGKRLSALLE